MAPKGKTAAPMDALELATYTLQVIQGEIPAQDNKQAQPIGPAEDKIKFITMLVITSFCLFVASYVVEAMGKSLAKALGLKGGKIMRFMASFLEFVYYTISIALGARIFWSTKWFWPSGWNEIMFDGRVQQIQGLQAYHIPGKPPPHGHPPALMPRPPPPPFVCSQRAE
jgi:hypothetical protein